MVETKKQSSLGRNLIIIVIALLCFIGGYALSSYNAHKRQGVDMEFKRDSVINKLRDDRSMLLKQYMELELRIDSLQNANNNQ